jgi:hypothetical protein
LAKRGAGAEADPWGLYRNLFTSHTRISLLGFSMGGLRALSLILQDKRLHKCVLLSSGGTLRSLQPPDVQPQSWQEYVKKVDHVGKKRLAGVIGAKAAEQLHERLRNIFFSPTLGPWQPSLERAARQNKILLVLGTRDNMRRDAIERMQLAELHTVAGMEHVLAEDIQFELRYREIINMVTEFLEPLGGKLPQPWTRKRMTKTMDSILKGAGLRLDDLTGQNLAERISGIKTKKKRSKAMDLYLRSKARFESDGELVDSVRRNRRKGR